MDRTAGLTPENPVEHPKRCPFCAGWPLVTRLHDKFIVRCGHCWASGPIGDFPADAVAKWGDRMNDHDIEAFVATATGIATKARRG